MPTGDAVLVSARDLAVDESLLTEESVPVRKQVVKTPATEATADRTARAAFLGSVAISLAAVLLYGILRVLTRRAAAKPAWGRRLRF